jgi:hypothetical protein
MERKPAEIIDQVYAQLALLSQTLTPEPGMDLSLSKNASFGLCLMLRSMQEDLAQARNEISNGRDHA